MPWFVALLLLAQAPVPVAPATPLTGRCTYVFDGDTIAVDVGNGRELRVRYAGIDAPEMEEPGGQRAARLNRALVLDREVALRPASAQTDPYGRFLAHPFVCDIDVESALLAAGLARRWRE